MLTKFELAATILASASCGALTFISLYYRKSVKEIEAHHARFSAAVKRSFSRWESTNKALDEKLSDAKKRIVELTEEKIVLEAENESLCRMNDSLNKRFLQEVSEKASLKKDCAELLDWKTESLKRIAALQDEAKAKTEEALLQKRLYEKLAADLTRQTKDSAEPCKKGSKAAEKK